ncbi:glycoside hydrolase [Patescibacteria group bacterium]|nr:glycoside hydrolase [Candidatus Falkowbacteria bacterium]MBU3905944.1 glycoside hydrolase [Patescibacteria group bacterium]MBU4027037.1 glycoside hydrolase [Patescibacteria group bacterium]MBU4073246.1 glycoside hydrolase [Patescibacteria group bacterium]MBU4102354.1 glycoside hydrolase [Patescibacteria group bacterium]
MRENIIEQCYQKSIKLLIENSNKHGLMAASSGKKAKERRYINIFGRDASICALGMIASGNKKLIAMAKKNLNLLAGYQTKLGQIPYSVNPEMNEILFYYMGDKDSTLWWLIAVDFYNKHGNDKKLYKKMQPKIKKALKWLFYQDQNNCGLIEQCEASDWEDLMPDNGNVLYTNVLWHKVLELYKFTKEKKIANDGLNNLFFPHSAIIKKSKFLQKDAYRIKLLNILKKNTRNNPYYLDYATSFYGSDRCDVFANILSVLCGVANKKRREKIINFLVKNKISSPVPVVVLFPDIKKGDSDWRNYLNHRKLNLPHQYHNGGAWPFVGSFWAMALRKAGKKDLGWQELEKVAEANKINNWQFNEWFHGKTGKPMGIHGQSWNAGTFLLAYHYLKGDFKF